MESSSGERMEAIVKNPLVKAGIPLVLSAAAAFISAKILSRRSSPVSESEEEDDDEDDREERNSQELESPATEMRNDVVGVLEDLKRREYELEMRFLIYKEMKERESAIMEIENRLGLEMARLEFLGREAALMAAEARRMGAMAGEFVGAVKKLEASMWEKGLAEKKAKRLRRKVREMCKVVREQSLCLKGRDEEIVRSREEVVRKSEVIVEMDKEIRAIKGDVDQLKEEKMELLKKLEMVEMSHHKNGEQEPQVVTKEAYDKVVEELELTEKDRAAKESELINLRWSNACLKRELTRHQQPPTSHDDDDDNSQSFRSEISVVDAAGNFNCQEMLHEVDWDGSSSAHNEEGQSSRRKRLMKKLRKWVDGGKMDERQKHEDMGKCFGKTLLEDVDHHAPRRNSFSSV